MTSVLLSFYSSNLLHEGSSVGSRLLSGNEISKPNDPYKPGGIEEISIGLHKFSHTYQEKETQKSQVPLSTSLFFHNLQNNKFEQEITSAPHSERRYNLFSKFRSVYFYSKHVVCKVNEKALREAGLPRRA